MGNKEDLVTFIDVRSHKIQREEQFKFEVIINTFSGCNCVVERNREGKKSYRR